MVRQNLVFAVGPTSVKSGTTTAVLCLSYRRRRPRIFNGFHIYSWLRQDLQGGGTLCRHPHSLF